MTRFLILILLLTLNSCKKNDIQIIPDGTYESNGTIQTDPLILYTANGEISDTNFIHDFIVRRSLSGRFQEKTGSGTTSTIQVSLLISGKTAIRKGDANNAAINYNIVDKSNNMVLLVQQDTIKIGRASAGNVSCDNIFMKVRQYPPAYTCESYPIAGGNVSYCLGQQQWPLIKNENELVIPLISYYYSSYGDNFSCGVSEIYLTDFFNKNFLSELVDPDTLVVQTSTLYLIRK
jgi:hypothetical protein